MLTTTTQAFLSPDDPWCWTSLIFDVMDSLFWSQVSAMRFLVPTNSFVIKAAAATPLT